MRLIRPLSFLLLLTTPACGDSGTTTPSDTQSSDTAADTTADSAPSDTSDAAAPDAADAADTSGPTDTSDQVDTSDAADTDTNPDLPDTSADTTKPEPTLIEATRNARCDLRTRVGTVDLERQGMFRFVSATVYDAQDPWLAAPELESDVCVFHRFTPSTCAPCATGERCGRDGLCVAEPMPMPLALAITSGDERAELASDPTTGQLWGQLALTGDGLGVELRVGDYVITVGEMSIPASLVDLKGVLEGSYDAPQRVILTWASGPRDNTVHTLIPINHHAGGPTFTDCAVPAAAGRLEVEEDMLTPLAVSTGLEFQGVEHVRYAAAETPWGCIEFRHLVRDFVFLESP
jgi:hypothetical protein